MEWTNMNGLKTSLSDEITESKWNEPDFDPYI